MKPDPRETVVDYDPMWPRTFDFVRERLAPALDDLGASIEHVGSTAVPGLAAKPIIDVDVVVPRAPDLVGTAIEL